MVDQPSVPVQDLYDASSIQKLDPLEHVRVRPGMYVGGTDAGALHHLVYEVVDNSVDEALAGYCDHILVTLLPNQWVSVEDNGRGIPVGLHQKTGRDALEVVMTEIGAGGKFGKGAYKVSGGLHGVGVSAVNALSERVIVQVKREGTLWQQTYSRGMVTSPVTALGTLQPEVRTGTKVSFQPDFTIMDHNEFNFTTLANRFREMAFVTRKITLTLRDERVTPFPHEITFYFEGGLRSFVQYVNRNREPIHEVVHMERDFEHIPEDKAKESYNIGIEIAFQYTDASSINELAFANTIATPDGGTHLTGLRSAITGVINRYARKQGFLKEKDTNFTGTDTLEGLTAIVNVKHPNPMFDNQTKGKLLNNELQGAVSQVVTEVFNEFLEMNPREARKIVDKCMISQRAREAARKARDLVRSGPSLLESTSLPGKLADCSKHDADSEVYIVEGDSAGGTAKQGRDRHFQAILPLRGKILNTERARLHKILDNNEVKALITALGTGIGDDFDISKLRYGRVIIMTDADVDGSHIRTLLLTFFFRHMLPLLTNGNLYIAQPPIFRLANGKEVEYLYNISGMTEQDILAQAVQKYKNPERVKVQRYKGLGEMNASQLWETTMDPGVRTLLQVTIDDAAEADRVFDMLMGTAVPPRRKFIQSHAKSVRNLDI
ncbi:MAG: DNA topoisomerase subunit B [Phototrophicaceae bacterium]